VSCASSLAFKSRFLSGACIWYLFSLSLSLSLSLLLADGVMIERKSINKLYSIIGQSNSCSVSCD